jgi:hypothetical protein
VCCLTHDVRDQLDREAGVPFELAAGEGWRCRCAFGQACRRKATGEDLHCDWCRSTAHQEFCERYPSLTGGLIEVATSQPEVRWVRGQMVVTAGPPRYSYGREPAWENGPPLYLAPQDFAADNFEVSGGIPLNSDAAQYLRLGSPDELMATQEEILRLYREATGLNDLPPAS